MMLIKPVKTPLRPLIPLLDSMQTLTNFLNIMPHPLLLLGVPAVPSDVAALVVVASEFADAALAVADFGHEVLTGVGCEAVGDVVLDGVALVVFFGYEPLEAVDFGVGGHCVVLWKVSMAFSRVGH